MIKNSILAVFTIICVQKISFAQSDTTIIYLTAFGDTTQKDAITYTKFYKDSSIWHSKLYFIKTGILRSEGSYRENNFSYPLGTFKNYSEEGKLLNISSYNNHSIISEQTYFYENGTKEAFVHYFGGKEQKCWDTLGNESLTCNIVEAHFKNGPDEWKRFLELNLNAHAATEAGAPAGNYTVVLQFIVNKNGSISNFEPTHIPRNCKACFLEAVKVLVKSHGWKPATINGEPVNSLVRQFITFVVG